MDVFFNNCKVVLGCSTGVEPAKETAHSGYNMGLFSLETKSEKTKEQNRKRNQLWVLFGIKELKCKGFMANMQTVGLDVHKYM